MRPLDRCAKSPIAPPTRWRPPLAQSARQDRLSRPPRRARSAWSLAHPSLSPRSAHLHSDSDMHVALPSIFTSDVGLHSTLPLHCQACRSNKESAAPEVPVLRTPTDRRAAKHGCFCCCSCANTMIDSACQAAGPVQQSSTRTQQSKPTLPANTFTLDITAPRRRALCRAGRVL